MNYFLKHSGGKVIRWIHRGRTVFRRGKKQEEGAWQPLPEQIIKDFNNTRPLGPQKYICYAPFKMMYFAFGGEVIACCHNRKHVLGRYPEKSLSEIWKGRELSVLRNYIAHEDLSHGCEVCKTLLLSRNYDGAKNALYDRYRIKPWPITMEFELENTCNLACVICNELFSSNIQGKAREKSPYDEGFVAQLKPFIPHLREAKFYGGEPFLIPVYYRIWELMLKLNPGMQILVQTNGTVLNDKVKQLLIRGRFSINVSIDSLNKERFEQIRKNADFEITLENTRWFADYCHKKGTHFGIIPTPNRLNWMDLPEITRWAGELGARVYFNTLITPLDLALWNLPPEELHDKHRVLSASALPAQNAVEKANQIHYRDFLTQLSSWEEANRKMPADTGKTAVTLATVQQIKNDFLSALSLNLEQKKEGELLMQLFHQSLISLSENHPVDMIYLTLKNIPISTIVDELETRDPDHLRKIAGKKLFEAGGQFIIIENQ